MPPKVGDDITLLEADVTPLHTARYCGVREALHRSATLAVGCSLQIHVPAPSDKGVPQTFTVTRETDGVLSFKANDGGRKKDEETFRAALTRRSVVVSQVHCKVTKCLHGGKFECAPVAAERMDPSLCFTLFTKDEGLTWVFIRNDDGDVSVTSAAAEHGDEVEDHAGSVEGDGERYALQVVEEKTATDRPTLSAREAVLVAIVRDKLSARDDIHAAAMKFSTVAAVDKACSPKACDPQRKGHRLWTITDGVFAATDAGVKEYAALLGAHPALACASHPSPDDVVLEAQPASTTSINDLLLASDAADVALTLACDRVSEERLRSDARDALFASQYVSGARVSEVLAAVDGELARRDFSKESAEQSAGLVATKMRQSAAKRAFVAACDELMAATAATHDVVAKVQRRHV